MKLITMALVICVTFLSCIRNQDQEQAASEAVEVMKETTQNIMNSKSGMIIHLSSGPENPHKALMALKMAKIMSEDKEVLVYLDINGVYTVFNDATDITFKEFPSSLSLITELKDKGVSIAACPSCIKAANKTPDDLMEGIQVATKDIFFTFCEGKVITLDY